MAKRNSNSKDADQTKGGAAGSTPGNESAEDRVIALAEQLGRIVGTIQAKADGWLDREALKQQISQVRDAATHLLEHLGVAGGAEAGSAGAGGAGQEPVSSPQNVGRGTGGRPPQRNSRAAAGGGRPKASAEASKEAGPQNNRQAARGRSGGVVDAPGKKHRKPVPDQVRANAADTGRLAKMKIVNANRRRGR